MGQTMPVVAQTAQASPYVRILPFSTTDHLYFRVENVDCQEVRNLNVQIMGHFDSWNESWFNEKLFVEGCLASIELQGYSEDGRIRFYLSDWTSGEVLNESSLWSFNQVGGYFEQVASRWVRWLEDGDDELPIWVSEVYGQNLGLRVQETGLYRIEVIDGQIDLALCTSYPCITPIATSGATMEVTLEAGQLYYLAVTTKDQIGGLSFISFTKLKMVYVPVVNR